MNPNKDVNKSTKEENHSTLARMHHLDVDWFDPIDRDLLLTIDGMIDALNIQPEIFPVPNGHVQFEYDTESDTENGSDSYLEFEFFPDKKVRMMMIQNANRPIHDMFELDVRRINQIVEMFFNGGKQCQS